jgi:hypothetical protein
MSPRTVVQPIAGPAGSIECAIDAPDGAARGLAVVCHPHPQFGGTMDNKVVQTLARAFVQLGWRSVRFNFRGIGGSSGTWDEGRGEVDDALAVVSAFRAAPQDRRRRSCWPVSRSVATSPPRPRAVWPKSRSPSGWFSSGRRRRSSACRPCRPTPS